MMRKGGATCGKNLNCHIVLRLTGTLLPRFEIEKRGDAQVVKKNLGSKRGERPLIINH